MPTATQIIDALNMEPLPGEGGYYRQTWALASDHTRPAATAILYLITPEAFSALHKLDADELFHFYLGDPCEQVVIDCKGCLTTTVLGPALLAGQHVQALAPAGCWQGTRLLEHGSWALVGTTMTPGYHQNGFQLATLDDLRNLSIEVAAVATRYLAEGA